jgi:hypothetical protein
MAQVNQNVGVSAIAEQLLDAWRLAAESHRPSE